MIIAPLMASCFPVSLPQLKRRKPVKIHGLPIGSYHGKINPEYLAEHKKIMARVISGEISGDDGYKLSREAYERIVTHKGIS